MKVNIYEYFFYKIYKYGIWVNKKKGPPIVQACLMMTVPLVTNAFNLEIFIISLLGKKNAIDFSSDEMKYFSYFLGISIFFINYGYLRASNKYVSILKRYKNESPASAKWGSLAVGAYIIGSFIVLMVSVVLIF